MKKIVLFTLMVSCSVYASTETDHINNALDNDDNDDFITSIFADKTNLFDYVDSLSENPKKQENTKEEKKKASTDAVAIAEKIHSFSDYIEVLTPYWRGRGHHGQLLPVSGKKVSIPASKIVRALIDYSTSLSKGESPDRTRTLERINDRIKSTPSDVLKEDFVQVAVLMLVNLLSTNMNTLPQQSQEEAGKALHFFKDFAQSHYSDTPLQQLLQNNKTDNENASATSPKEEESKISHRKKRKKKKNDNIETAESDNSVKNENHPPEVKFNKILSDIISIPVTFVSFKGGERKEVTKDFILCKGEKLKRKYVVTAVTNGNIAELDWMAENCKFDKSIANYRETGFILDCVEMSYPHNHLIHIAVEKNNSDMVNYLLNKGAKLDITNDEGDTALHIAVQNNNLKLVELLLSRGANPNSANRNQETPLHFAVAISKRMVELLVNKGSDVNSHDKNGLTPVQLAYFRGDKESTDFLLAHNASINELEVSKLDSKQSGIALKTAIANNNAKIVSSIIKNGFDINKPILEGRTALSLAAESNHMQMVNLLLLNGAKVNAIDEYTKHTPLHIASRDGNTAIAEVLIKAGADQNARNNANETPLHLAVQDDNNIEVVKLLIKNKANVDAKADADCTPLHYAAWKNSQKIAQLLVKAGANKNAKQYDKLLPIDRADKDRIIWRRILQ